MDFSVKNFEFFAHLKQFAFVDEIWLYGSRARGDASERSDIDLAIVCPKATEDQWHLIQDVIADADTLLKIDYVRFDALEQNNELRKNILKDKQVLFKREIHCGG